METAGELEGYLESRFGRSCRSVASPRVRSKFSLPWFFVYKAANIVFENRGWRAGSGGRAPLRKQDQAPFVPLCSPAVLPGLLGTDWNALLFASHST